jgi:putative SOS response-associated peptidase YedK
MPAILAPDDYATWLDHDVPLKEAHALLKPYRNRPKLPQ